MKIRVDEWCPNCDNEQSYDYDTEQQELPRCPECGEVLLPCSLCEDCSQAKCPFKSEKDYLAKK